MRAGPGDGTARTPCARFFDGGELGQRFLLPAGRHAGHRHRCAAGPGSGCDHRDAAAGHVRTAAGHRADHAGRNLLRRAVRRLDHGDPREPARRVLVRGDGTGRLPDGAQGPGGRGAGNGGYRLVFRRHGLYLPDRAGGAAAVGDRAQFRSCRLLLADGPGAGRLDRTGQRLAAARDRHDRAGTAAGTDRHRCEFRHGPLLLRSAGTARRGELRRGRDGRVRPRRDHRQSGGRISALARADARSLA